MQKGIRFAIYHEKYYAKNCTGQKNKMKIGNQPYEKFMQLD